MITYLKQRLFYIFLFLFSFLSLLISPESASYTAVFTTFILFYLIYQFNQKCFTFVVFFIAIILSLYYPISEMYGALNSGIIAAFLETDTAESLSFLSKMKWVSLAFPFCYLLVAVIVVRLKKYYQPSPFDNKKRILCVALFLVFLLSLLYIPIKYYYDNKDNDDSGRITLTLANSPINVISFFANIYRSVSLYYEEKALLEEARLLPSPWKITTVMPHYQNYVLIIGESARRDYFSTYGFDLKTSPFLDETKGYINRGYISAAPATYHSLLKTLYLKINKKVDYQHNIITLAKGAGFETEWLSNQGSMGQYDTIASRVGASADFSYFLKTGAFNIKNNDDFELIDIFKQRLATPSSKPRLFVLHMMGSHTQFCNRLKDEEKILKFINKNMSCYVNTILKTDKFIQNVVESLQQQAQSYSLIYFSDHGLSYTDTDSRDDVSLDYREDTKASYEVPFFKLSSDDTQRTVVNTQRSAFNFLNGFAQWLGISSPQLDANYDFFSEQDDKEIEVFNFTENVKFDSLKQEEPINNRKLK